MKNVLKGLYMSMGMFCTIPMPGYWDEKGAKHMMLWFPVVGAVIGLFWYASALLLAYLGAWAPLPLLSAVLMIMPFLFSGLIHLDGFMDTSDAILSRRSVDDKLRILKDPNTGAFAVIMAIMLFIMLFAASYSILQRGVSLILIFIIPIISRSCSAAAMLCIRPMSEQGYVRLFKPEPVGAHRCAVFSLFTLALAAAFLLAGISGIIVSVAVIFGFSAAMLIACSSFAFKGVSGDLAGFSLVIAELCRLMALAVF